MTARPQPGNPPPRMFRLAPERAIVNRLGFNNRGAQAVAKQLAARLARRPAIPIGINIGCSKVAVGDELAEIEDYRFSARLLAPLADYLAINVSSPNTPGLRNLHEPRRLARLVAMVRNEVEHARASRPPAILVKLSARSRRRRHPGDLRRGARRRRERLHRHQHHAGAPGCTERGRRRRRAGCRARRCARARPRSWRACARRAVARVPLIGVGGVSSVDDVREKLAAGATWSRSTPLWSTRARCWRGAWPRSCAR